MEIVVKNEERESNFADLDYGDIFKYKHVYYMRIYEIDDYEGDTYNAIELEKGLHRAFNGLDEVEKVNATLVIEK